MIEVCLVGLKFVVVNYKGYNVDIVIYGVIDCFKCSLEYIFEKNDKLCVG